MAVVKSPDELKQLEGGNVFRGVLPEMENSSIEFVGEGNILICDKDVKLVNSKLKFNGSNAVIHLGSDRHKYFINATVNNECVLFIGKGNYFNGTLNIVLSEHKHCFIGNDCLISFGIWIRNADPHLVYSTQDMKRVNPTRSIFIGDHVWIGQSAMILKGTQIDSGSIVGAMSLVAGKRIASNTSWGGNPAKMIAENIFWDETCVHTWTQEKTEKSATYASLTKLEGQKLNRFIYNYSVTDSIEFDEIDRKLATLDAEGKAQYLTELYENTKKNRFTHNLKKEKSFLKLKHRIRKLIKRITGR